MIDSHVLVCDTMGFKVICTPKLKTISNQEPNLMMGEKWTEKWKLWSITLKNTLAPLFYLSSFTSMVSESSRINNNT